MNLATVLFVDYNHRPILCTQLGVVGKSRGHVAGPVEPKRQPPAGSPKKEIDESGRGQIRRRI
jgi:hypothetical protein